MADTNDTIDGLLAEFRGYSAGMPPSYHVTMSWADFRRMLDRFDAAHKRERGDAAKLREALAPFPSLCDWLVVNAPKLGIPDMVAKLRERGDKARAALAAPPRNCDIGTAKEQDERFHRFCVKHHTGSCAGCHNPVGDYTVANGVRECALVWAQMPYDEEGGAK